jgi:hypothetical protein
MSLPAPNVAIVYDIDLVQDAVPFPDQAGATARRPM